MQPEYYFFFIFLLTLTFTRIILSGKRIEASKLLKKVHSHFHIHHYMYGIALIILGIFTKNLIVYAVGSALFVDEIPLFVGRKWTWQGYYSKESSLILLFLTLLVFCFSKYLLLAI